MSCDGNFFSVISTISLLALYSGRSACLTISHTSNELSSDRLTAIKYARFFIERIDENAFSVDSPTRIKQPNEGICFADKSILRPLLLTVIPEPSNPAINLSNKGLMPIFGVGFIIRMGSLAETKM